MDPWSVAGEVRSCLVQLGSYLVTDATLVIAYLGCVFLKLFAFQDDEICINWEATHF
jgi:hypothetical protein